jgi:hypothetical protein
MKNDKTMLSPCEASGGVPVDHREHGPDVEHHLDLIPVAAVVWALLCARALATTYEPYPCHLIHGIYASSDFALQTTCPYRNFRVEQVQSDDRRGRRIRSDKSLSTARHERVSKVA